MNLPDLGQGGLSKCQKDKIPCSCVACTDNILMDKYADIIY